MNVLKSTRISCLNMKPGEKRTAVRNKINIIQVTCNVLIQSAKYIQKFKNSGIFLQTYYSIYKFTESKTFKKQRQENIHLKIEKKNPDWIVHKIEIRYKHKNSTLRQDHKFFTSLTHSQINLYNLHAFTVSSPSMQQVNLFQQTQPYIC